MPDPITLGDHEPFRLKDCLYKKGCVIKLYLLLNDLYSIFNIHPCGSLWREDVES